MSGDRGSLCTHQLETTVRERDEALVERDARARELAQAAAEISGYKSTQAARGKALEERRAELDTHFKGLASEALKFSTEEFRKQAAEQLKQHQELAGKDLKAREVAVENLVRPVRESFDKLREHVDASDKARVADTTRVSEGVTQLMAETSGLRKILHNPQLRGEWGKQHLRNVLDSAGMTPHVEYVEQGTLDGAPDGTRLRPDVLVRIPGGATVVIDAKTPHDRYDQALRSNDEQEQARLLAEHAAALAGHAKEARGPGLRAMGRGFARLRNDVRADRPNARRGHQRMATDGRVHQSGVGWCTRRCLTWGEPKQDPASQS